MRAYNCRMIAGSHRAISAYQSCGNRHRLISQLRSRNINIMHHALVNCHLHSFINVLVQDPSAHVCWSKSPDGRALTVDKWLTKREFRGLHCKS